MNFYSAFITRQADDAGKLPWWKSPEKYAALYLFISGIATIIFGINIHNYGSLILAVFCFILGVFLWKGYLWATIVAFLFNGYTKLSASLITARLDFMLSGSHPEWDGYSNFRQNSISNYILRLILTLLLLVAFEIQVTRKERIKNPTE